MTQKPLTRAERRAVNMIASHGGLMTEGDTLWGKLPECAFYGLRQAELTYIAVHYDGYPPDPSYHYIMLTDKGREAARTGHKQ